MNIPKIVQELPPAPKDVRSWILNEVAKGRYLIYSLKEDEVVCTLCGKSHKISKLEQYYGYDTPKHNVKCFCPSCGVELICKSKGIGRKNLTEMTRVMVLVKRGKSIYISITEVDINFEGILPEVSIYLQAVYKFNHKEQLYVKHNYGWYTGEHWETRKKINIPDVGGWNNWNQPKRQGLHVYNKNFDKIFNNTDLKYADVKEVYKEKDLSAYGLLQYIYLNSKFQSVELLRKAGFWSLVNSKMEMESGSRAINWKAIDLRKIFNLDMGQIKEIRKENYRLRDLEIYKRQLKAGDPVNISAVHYIRCCYRDKKIQEYISIGKAANYLDKQPKQNKVNSTLNDYEDYLNECEKLGFNLNKKEILFPKNFVQAHNRTSELINKEKDRVDAKAFKENQLKISKMKEPYYADGLLIRPAKSAAELRAEGNYLGHCVGGYSNRIVNGSCAILFIRTQDMPDKPYYTLELSPKGAVIQCRGGKNCNMTDEVEAFVDKWHQEVIKGKKPKKKRNVA